MRYFFLLTLILLAISVEAQFKGKIFYKKTVDDGLLPQARVTNYVMYFNNEQSIETVVDDKNIKSGNVDENHSIKVVPGRSFFILKNFKSKKMILSDYAGFKAKLIDDTLSNFKWVITKEKRKILNFDCTKATTKFRGRLYNAWFTYDVPIQNGPWKFCGLPGLIVKIFDDKLMFTYELTGINLKEIFNDKIIALPIEYKKDKAISHKEFIQLVKKKLNENDKLAKVVSTGDDGSYGSLKITLPEKMEKF